MKIWHPGDPDFETSAFAFGLKINPIEDRITIGAPDDEVEAAFDEILEIRKTFPENSSIDMDLERLKRGVEICKKENAKVKRRDEFKALAKRAYEAKPGEPDYELREIFNIYIDGINNIIKQGWEAELLNGDRSLKY